MASNGPPHKKFCPENRIPSAQSTNPMKNKYSINQLKGVQCANGKGFKLKKIHNDEFSFKTNGCNASNGNKNDKSIMKFSGPNPKKFLKQKQALPIFAVRKHLLCQLKKNETNILIGETGSGKTTQVPQFLYEHSMLRKGGVVITQPRRVAAVSVAARVAQEVGTELGDLVGYSVRFENMSSDKTKIKFATDGMVLRESMVDKLLMRYSWIILDEAHERTINTDILFGVVKMAQKIRKDKNKEPLHILVMSATLDPEKFSRYFNNCQMLSVEGREHKLSINFTTEKKDDYVVTCLSTIMQIHKEAPLDQGILVFLTGQEEIDNACLAMNKLMKRVQPGEYMPIKASALYSALPQHIQMEVLKPTTADKRHVIFSTNIAETSVTIPGIRYVIDSGKAKIRTYNPTTGADVLKVCQISQAQSWQRAGRAGREADGTCYHVFTEAQFEKMQMMPSPEIHRTNLATVVLQLLTIGVTDVLKFDFMDKPRMDYLENAIQELLLLGAVEKTAEGVLKLTFDGKVMAAFPLEPRYAKILLMGPKYNCTQEVLTIIALLSGEQVLTIPTGKMRSVAMARHEKLASVEGDHMTLLKIYQQFKAAKKNKKWCHENFLNHRNLTHASAIRKQLSDLCVQRGLRMVSCGDSTEDVPRCMLAGLFTQVAELQPGLKYVTLANREETHIHPSSVLFNTRSCYLMYTQLINTGKSYMHTVSCVQPEWLYEVAPDYFRKHHIRADASLYANKS